MNKEFRVYTIKLARYLTDKGFQITHTAQDVKVPTFINWFFNDTPELRKALDSYKVEQDNYYASKA